MILEDRTEIAAQPRQVFAFFRHMEANYRRWHPDHIAFRWIHGRGLEAGVEFAFEEIIGGKRMKRRLRFVEVVTDRTLAFEPTSRFVRLFMPRLSFEIEPTEGGCILVARIRIRTGPVGAWLNRREFSAVRRHMRQEGENLKMIVESSARQTASFARAPQAETAVV